LHLLNYYVRAFCSHAAVPELAKVQAWLRECGSPAMIDDPDHAIGSAEGTEARSPVVDLNRSDWQQVAIVYAKDKLPILVECHRDDGSSECEMQKEIAQFVNLLGDPADSPARRRVLDHLKLTRFTVTCQLPEWDMDEEGFDASSQFLLFFVRHCGGMVHAEGEGFYAGSRLIVPLQ